MRSSPMSLVVLAIFLALLGPTSAFWRMPCRSRSGLARVDPFVNYGSLSEHAHAIHGSSGKFVTCPCFDLQIDLDLGTPSFHFT